MSAGWKSYKEHKKLTERAATLLAPCGRIDHGSACLECQEKGCKYAKHYLSFEDDKAVLGKVQMLRGLAQKALADNKVENAKKYLDEMLALREADNDALNIKGCIAFAEKRYDDAMKCFDDVILTEPNSAHALNNKGAALFLAGKTAEALALFEKTTSLAPNSPASWNNRGVALLASGKRDAAASVLAQAESSSARSSELLYHLGAINGALGKRDEAARYLDAAIDADKANAFAAQARKSLK